MKDLFKIGRYVHIKNEKGYLIPGTVPIVVPIRYVGESREIALLNWLKDVSQEVLTTALVELIFLTPHTRYFEGYVLFSDGSQKIRFGAAALREQEMEFGHYRKIIASQLAEDLMDYLWRNQPVPSSSL